MNTLMNISKEIMQGKFIYSKKMNTYTHWMPLVITMAKPFNVAHKQSSLKCILPAIAGFNEQFSMLMTSKHKLMLYCLLIYCY